MEGGGSALCMLLFTVRFSQIDFCNANIWIYQVTKLCNLQIIRKTNVFPLKFFFIGLTISVSNKLDRCWWILTRYFRCNHQNLQTCFTLEVGLWSNNQTGHGFFNRKGFIGIWNASIELWQVFHKPFITLIGKKKSSIHLEIDFYRLKK